jgi:chromosomal replication initiator protein
MVDNHELWRSVLGELEVSLTRASFSTWVKNTAILTREDGQITIGVPNIFSKRWLEDKFHQEIQDTLSKMDPSIHTVTYKVATEALEESPASAPIKKSGSAAPKASNQTALPMTSAAAAHPKLNPRYTFASFVVGSSNEMAYAACQAVAANPGTKYNPLYLYGGVGLGKTHLMQAVGNEILRHDPNRRIEYVTIEAFTNEFIEAIQKKKNSAFTNKYRNVDVLIIDDMQFLVGKEKTQDVFFHTFNALHQLNKQIIISSDKPPQMLVQLEERLRSRFGMGLTADIQPPDLETRLAILQAKAASAGRVLPLDVLDYLARNAQQSIRELEGALTQLLAACDVKGQEPSVALATKLLTGQAGVKTRSRPLSAKSIIERVASYFDLTTTEITGSKRDKEIVLPRQIVMYIMRQDIGLSFPKIAKAVGGRDHTTAMHSVSKITRQIEEDEDLRGDIQAIREQLAIR